MGHRPDLWLSYQTTLFYWPGKSIDLAQQVELEFNSFIILTACNPKGMVVKNEKNMQLHENLRNALLAQQFNCFEIVGVSPDLEHQEAGFAIATTVEKGVALGYQYQQNAIYHIENDELWLVPVLMNQASRTRMGRFSERVVNV